MPVRTYWEDPNKTTIHVAFEDKWDAHDFERMIEEVRVMRSTVRHRFDVILNFTASFSGHNLNLLSIIGRIDDIISNHTGVTLVVKPPPYIKYLVGVMEKIAPRITEDLHILDSMDEARELLLQRKPPPIP